MKGWLTFALGLLGVVIGAVWTLQGLGYVGGSAMTGQRIWAIIGPFVSLCGVFLLFVAVRARRERTRPPV